jgi:hypothetical protein
MLKGGGTAGPSLLCNDIGEFRCVCSMVKRDRIPSSLYNIEGVLSLETVRALRVLLTRYRKH